MRADPSQEREASAGMSWVLVEVAPAQIAVWPERSPEGRAALKGTDRTIIVIPRSQVAARKDTERPDERLRGALRSVSRCYHDMAHTPDDVFDDCGEVMCVSVRQLLRDGTDD